MEWIQVLTILAANAGLFLWARSVSRADHRHLESWVKAAIDGIREEMKDFHGRLCSIEEKNKK